MAYIQNSTLPSLEIQTPPAYSYVVAKGVMGSNGGISKSITLPAGAYNFNFSQSGVNAEIGGTNYSLGAGSTIFTLGGTSTLTSVQPAFVNNTPVWAPSYSSDIQNLSFIRIKYLNNKYTAVAYQETGFTYSKSGATSIDGISWTKFSFPSEGYWYDIAYGNGKYVATSLLASSGTIFVSTDLISWQTGTVPTSGSNYYVEFGNNRFVVFTNSTQSHTSTDGITWTAAVNLPNANGAYRPPKYYNGYFYSTPISTTKQVIISTDGILWVTYTMPETVTASNGYIIAYGNRTYVGVSNSTSTVTSTDAITWTLRTVVNFADWNSFNYGNGIFLATSENSGQSVQSTDGITWTASGVSLIGVPVSSTYGNGKFIYTPNNNYKGYVGIAAPNPSSPISFAIYAGAGTYNSQKSSSIEIKTSTPPPLGDYVILDGLIRRAGSPSVSRSSSTIIPTNTYEIVSGATKYDSTFIAYSTLAGNVNIGSMTYPIPGDTPTVINHKYYENKNLFEFSSNTPTIYTRDTLPLVDQWRAVTYNKNQFIAISASGNSIRSTDGATWVNSGQLPPGIYNTLISSPTRYVAVQQSAALLTSSTDGLTWSLYTTPSAHTYKAAAYGLGKFVFAANDTNYLMTSQSGISNWNQFSSNGSASSLSYGKNIFVGTFDTPLNNTTSSIFASRDGVGASWTSVPFFTGRYTCSTYGSGTWLVPSYGTNTFYYSTDSINWSTGSFPFSGSWTSCAYGNGKFVVITEDGSILTSTDLITWSSENFGTNWASYALCYGGRHVIIATSPGTATSDFAWSQEVPNSRTASIHFGIYGADWDVV